MGRSWRGKTRGREFAKKVSATAQVKDAGACNVAGARGMGRRQSSGDGVDKT